MKTSLEFNYKKATQALNYFAQRSGGKISKLDVIKFVYLADRYHLRKYGRPIVNDEYWAMPYGPIGSTVKDIAEFSDFLSKKEKEYVSEFLAQGDVEDNTVVSIQDVDPDVFSETDLESLEFAFDKFKDVDLVKVSHLYPEWSKFESALKSDDVTREQMDYKDFFKDPENIEGDEFSLPEEELESSRYLFEENFKVNKAWSNEE